MSEEDKKIILDAHNHYRSQAGDNDAANEHELVSTTKVIAEDVFI